MYGINTLPYYTNTSMTPYGYARGGIAGLRPGYGFGGKIRGAIKSITKPIAKVLDKIVPNEIKPALPYIAAVAPFFGGFGLTSLLPEFSSLGSVYGPIAQRALSGSIFNAASQLSQEGAADRGLNLPSNLFAAATAGLSGTDTANQLLGEKTLGMVGQTPYTASQILNLPEGSSILNDIQIGNLPFAEQAKNIALEGSSMLSRPLGAATEAVNNQNLFSLDFAKGAATPLIGAASEQAYNAALDANKKYQDQLTAMGQSAASNRQSQIDYIRRAMQSAGFTEDEIGSAITRSGFMYGGDVDEGFAEGGLMSLKMGGMPVEMDLRAKGGFVPIGKKERADDVPARLSKNEFVFTAKAVRNAGGGDIRKGAKRMYQIMNQLEARA